MVLCDFLTVSLTHKYTSIQQAHSLCLQGDEDPLGSGDDEQNSEDEDKDFDTEDTIACQWEKVCVR